MVTHRVKTAIVLIPAVLMSLLLPARAALPVYKLGDVAAEDIITPVRLTVPDPEATAALKQKIVLEVPFVVRVNPQGAMDAENGLRQSIATAKASFMTVLTRALHGGAPTMADLYTPAYAEAMRVVASESGRNLPLDKLAPLWVLGVSDQAFVESLLQPLRRVMARPIVSDGEERALPANQAVRLVPEPGPGRTPTAQDLETTGTTVKARELVGLSRAQRMVEGYFPAGQEQMGRFAASFVRTNAYPDSGLTALLREKRAEGVTVNQTYEPGQVIIHQGQTIDRRALRALAALREQSLIGTLQDKLEQERSVSAQITSQTKLIAGGLGAMFLVLLLVFWRLRARLVTPLVPLPDAARALPGAEQKALPGGEAGAADWRQRALAAEQKAERAQAAIRSGVLGWMRERIFQTLFRQRSELLSVQQQAEAEMRELERRLERLHAPLQDRINAYERRIAELERDLAARGEDDRELIGARIDVARQQLSAERERGGYGLE